MTSYEAYQLYCRRQTIRRRLYLLLMVVGGYGIVGYGIYLDPPDAMDVPGMVAAFALVILVIYLVLCAWQAVAREAFMWRLLPYNASDAADALRQIEAAQMPPETLPTHPPGDPAYWDRPVPEDFYAPPSHRPPRLVARPDERLLPRGRR